MNRPNAIDVDISDTQAHLRVDPRRLEAQARAVLEAQGVSSGSISLAIVDDATIHLVNRDHLDHDCPTDVISFDLGGGDDEIHGELVISAETARREAASAGLDPGDELTLYLVHGLLHLCGFDDLDPESRAAMRAREAEVLRLIGVGHPGADSAGLESGEDRTCLV